MLNFFGNKPPHELTQEDADRYNEYLCNNFKQNSRIPYGVAVNHFFDMICQQSQVMLKQQLINKEIDPVEYTLLKEKSNIRIPVPAKVPVEHDTLTEREVRKIIDCAKDDSFSHALLYVFAETIQRKNDVRKLDLDDFNYEKLRIRFKSTKGGKPHITNISKQCAQAVRHYITTARIQLKDGSNALFVSTKGRRISKAVLYNRVKEYGAKAGITKRIFPHLFRISGITNMDEQGVSPRVGMKISGHRDERTYMRYIHPEGKRVRKEFDRTLGNGNNMEGPKNPIESTPTQTEPESGGNHTNGVESPESILTRALVSKEMTIEEYEKALAILMKYKGKSDKLGYIG
jgi:integrase